MNKPLSELFKDAEGDPLDGCVSLIALPLLLSYSAWVTWLMWGWFVVPLGAPSINIAHALGLRIIVGFSTTIPRADAKPGKHWYSSTVFALSFTTFALAMGFVAHLLMSLTWVNR